MSLATGLVSLASIVLMPGAGSAAEAARPPLAFVANDGITDPEARFLARGAGLAAWITDRGARLRISPAQGPGAVVFLEFEGARAAAVSGEKRLPFAVNHLEGADPSRWVRGASAFAQVRLDELLPGVDLRFREQDGRLEYDLELAPCADVAGVVARVEGATLRLLRDDLLAIDTVAGTIEQSLPATYEVLADGSRRALRARFRLLDERRFGFAVEGRDSARPLVVDPGLSFGTYLGGSLTDGANAVDVDSTGVYVVGSTSSTNFPTTSGAYDPAANGLSDAFVAKLALNGTSLAWATYLGGAGNDFGSALDVGPGGLLVAGNTGSPNFPIVQPVQVFDPSYNGGTDVFVANLATSNGFPFWSTFFGGDEIDAPAEIVEDNGGCYVAGTTTSPDMPTTGAFDMALGGTQDLFVMRLSFTGNLLRSTYLGGTGIETAGGLAVQGGNVHVIGSTTSTNFPVAGAVFQVSSGGGQDACFAKLDANLNTLAYAGYHGGTGQDNGIAIAVDSTGRAMLLGSTFGTVPMTTGSYDTTPNGGLDLWLMRLLASGFRNAATCLGGAGDDAAARVRLDGDARAVIAGHSLSANFPTTPNAAQPAHAGNGDAIVAVVSADLAQLRYATYHGGAGFDTSGGLALDAAGDAFVAGTTFSANLPTSATAFDKAIGGSQDAFVARLPTRICAGTPSSFKYGTGKAGTLGTPSLSDTAPPALGTISGIKLTNGKPGAIATLVLGAAQIAVPFDCGKLLASPDLLLVVPLPIDASGTLVIESMLPENPILCGFTLYHQMWFTDPGAPCFYHTAQTNGLARTFGSL